MKLINVVSILFRLFDKEEMTHGEMRSFAKQFYKAFPIAYKKIADDREEQWAEFGMGRKGIPYMPSEDIEDEFYDDVQFAVKEVLGEEVNPEIVELVIRASEIAPSDYYNAVRSGGGSFSDVLIG